MSDAATGSKVDEPHDTDAEDAQHVSKGERTRQRLLELAILRFGERGYRATSVSSIAREAGVTQAAVYAYFDNKEALFQAAVDADAAAIIERARSACQSAEVHALYPSLLISVLGMLDEHPLARRVLGGDERAQLERLLNLPALTALTRWVAQRVTEAQDEGAARDDIDAVAFADGFEALLLGLLMAIVQIGSTTEQRRQLGVLTVWDKVLRPSPLDGSGP